ncbi:MAG: MerR family transcriptional regulator [Atopobiaceae bacterium]|nr:MerR family transcriptional regulator [Atopobiaceae bacterium]
MLDQTQKTTYSTGELARACEVSVRTVQYYDQKGLLPHSDLTEGGRRVYTQDDLAKLRKIMLPSRWACSSRPSVACWRARHPIRS